MYHSQNNKSIGIFGLSRTGISAYQALCKNATVVCYDDSQDIRGAFIGMFGSRDLADLCDQKWHNLDKIIISPGVPRSHKIFQIASDSNILITSDIDILFEENTKSKFVSITGTNGKSTTTTLIGHIMTSNMYDYVVGGNIGVASLSLPVNKAGYVLELSSFQLELLNKFKTKIAVILNVTKDHLDRHHTMEDYIKIKESLLYRMDHDGIGVIGIDNEITKYLYEKHKNRFRLIPISAHIQHAEGVCCFKEEIYDNFFEKTRIPMPFLQCLQGDHNRENIAASFAVCRILGLSWKKIMAACLTFKGLPHRMQYVGNVKNVHFYNDSKATNADAASKSLGSLNNIYWILGGISKEGGIDCLKPLFSHVYKAYLFGKDKMLFADSLNDLVNYEIFDNMEEAFHAAFKDAIHNNDTINNILLAPSASSYDQFKNFEHRGQAFVELCQQCRGKST